MAWKNSKNIIFRLLCGEPPSFRNNQIINQMKRVIGFGNPLLDITISSKEDVPLLLQKYNLNPDGQKEISKNEMDRLGKDVEGLTKHMSAGGCSQNTLRVLQWLLNKKCNVYIFGSVGDDKEADILRNALNLVNVHPRYIVQKNLKTGTTIALVHGAHRSLVAHIGAAEVFPLSALLAHEEFFFLFNLSDIVYIEAYFLSNRFETAKYVVDLCKSNHKQLVFNLCGAYIFEVVPEAIKYLVKHSQIIFGNKDEFEALQQLLNTDSLEATINKILDNESSDNNKTIVITDGPNTVQCYYGKEILKLDPPTLNPSEIKDTNAAGDAFVGGFIAGLTTSKDIKECVKLGFYAALCIIKETGCTIPKYDPKISI